MRCGRFTAGAWQTSLSGPSRTPGTPAVPIGTRLPSVAYGSWRIGVYQTSRQVAADFTQGMHNLGQCLSGLQRKVGATVDGCRRTADRVAAFSDAVGTFCRRFTKATAAFSSEQMASTEALTAPPDAVPPQAPRARYLWVCDDGRWFSTDDPRLNPARAGETGWRCLDTRAAPARIARE